MSAGRQRQSHQQSDTRTERDSLGPREVPSAAYYGVQTARARENFPISGLGPHPALVWATVLIKKAAALVNLETGRLDPRVGQAIIQAADEALAGNFADQFVVDVFQAGAGTSHNMNVNEVLANRASEILGGARGDYTLVHPNDHVNMAQSTNDVFPTAMRLAALRLAGNLQTSLTLLHDALADRARAFDGILKSGRTHLQDAVPIRLGQEFGAYARSVELGAGRVARAFAELEELGLGGTAVGTGLNAEPAYVARVADRLRDLSGLPVRATPNRFQAMQSLGVFAAASSSLRNLAVDLGKIANDLRLLASGPQTGLAEITLPPVQPGSSIMPGKVNPVMAEMLNMVCFHVIGADVSIGMAAEAGQLELNVMMPVVAYELLFSLEVLTNATRVFAERCVAGIQANPERARHWLERSVGLATALNAYIGYARAAEVAKEAAVSGRSIREIVLARGLLSPEQLDTILAPATMTEPGIPGQDGGTGQT